MGLVKERTGNETSERGDWERGWLVYGLLFELAQIIVLMRMWYSLADTGYSEPEMRPEVHQVSIQDTKVLFCSDYHCL